MPDETPVTLFTTENGAVVPTVLSGILIRVAWPVVRLNHRLRHLWANYGDIFARIS